MNRCFRLSESWACLRCSSERSAGSARGGRATRSPAQSLRRRRANSSLAFHALRRSGSNFSYRQAITFSCHAGHLRWCRRRSYRASLARDFQRCDGQHDAGGCDAVSRPEITNLVLSDSRPRCAPPAAGRDAACRVRQRAVCDDACLHSVVHHRHLWADHRDRAVVLYVGRHCARAVYLAQRRCSTAARALPAVVQARRNRSVLPGTAAWLCRRVGPDHQQFNCRLVRRSTALFSRRTRPAKTAQFTAILRRGTGR